MSQKRKNRIWISKMTIPAILLTQFEANPRASRRLILLSKLRSVQVAISEIDVCKYFYRR